MYYRHWRTFLNRIIQWDNELEVIIDRIIKRVVLLPPTSASSINNTVSLYCNAFKLRELNPPQKPSSP